MTRGEAKTPDFTLYEVRLPVSAKRVLLTRAAPRRIPRSYAHALLTATTPFPGSRVSKDKRFFDERLALDTDRLEPYLKLSGPGVKPPPVSRGMKRLAQRYDVIPYINEHEDPGSVSAAALNPKKLRLRRIARIPYKPPKF